MGKAVRNQDDLDKAKSMPVKWCVAEEFWNPCMPIFQRYRNVSDESLIAWRWVVAGETYWTASNDLQLIWYPVRSVNSVAGSWVVLRSIYRKRLAKNLTVQPFRGPSRLTGKIPIDAGKQL